MDASPSEMPTDHYAMSDTPEDKKALKPRASGAVATPKFKRGLKGFLTETRREMKKVVWPTRRETTRLTLIVLALVLLAGAGLSFMGWIADTGVMLITKGKVS